MRVAQSICRVEIAEKERERVRVIFIKRKKKTSIEIRLHVCVRHSTLIRLLRGWCVVSAESSDKLLRKPAFRLRGVLRVLKTICHVVATGMNEIFFTTILLSLSIVYEYLHDKRFYFKKNQSFLTFNLFFFFSNLF